MAAHVPRVRQASTSSALATRLVVRARMENTAQRLRWGMRQSAKDVQIMLTRWQLEAMLRRNVCATLVMQVQADLVILVLLASTTMCWVQLRAQHVRKGSIRLCSALLLAFSAQKILIH